MTRIYYAPRPLDRAVEVPLDPQADLSVLNKAKMFAAPRDPELWDRWREQLTRWRTYARQHLAYSGARYRTADSTCFVLGMASLWDEMIYDHKQGEFVIDAFVRHSERNFGGFDGVLLWHAYPVIGIDGRKQFDYYRGLPELPELVRSFHHLGIRVFIPYLPWAADAETVDDIIELVAWLGADGVFLDTLKEGSEALRRALDALSPDLLIGGESPVPLARLHDHQMSWAQWFGDSWVPGVMRAKWFERRHIMHHTRRWHRSHLEELHSAWLNGCGILVWENVFGVWVGWSDKDRETLCAMRRVHRQYAELLLSDAWTPLADYPGNNAHVYASRWEHEGRVLWTIVNTGDDYEGPWLLTDDRPACHWLEVTSGTAVIPVPAGAGKVRIGGSLPAGGIAAVLASPHPVTIPSRPMADGDPSFPGRMAVRMRTPKVIAPSVPEDMVALPGGRHELTVRYRMRETGLYGETPFIDEWKPALVTRLHYLATLTRVVEIAPFAIARSEITNAQYAAFLEATGYTPKRRNRFLAHWQSDYPTAEQLGEPVGNIDLGDARAYAAWVGCRLPSEDEWQIAAAAQQLERLEPLVWNLTESEHTDGRTRFVILKGGSAFHNPTSAWFFDGGAQPPEVAAKLLILAGGLSRSPSVGFRCAVDLSVAESAS